MTQVTPAELGGLLSRGWRRFGPCYFRPACTPCGECVTLRIPVSRFEPTKSQRRAARRARALRRVVGPPRVDEERLALYALWHATREDAHGWAPSSLSAKDYIRDFAFPHPAVREVAFYDDAAGGRLVGVGIWDDVGTAMSAAFFFHHPAYRAHSLGVANVVLALEEAQARGMEHVYLGYRVHGCPSLLYKARYRPHELLVGRPGDDETPVWREAPAE